MLCGGNIINVVAMVVSLSKAITKLTAFSTEMRERIFAACVCVCVCVVDSRQISYKPECCGADIYIAELNNKLCIITPNNFKPVNV
jgi:hypothetical protein